MAVNFRCVLAALLAIAVLSASANVHAVPRVLFTIDVESTEKSTETLGLPQQVDAVCEDGSACGLMEIVRMLRERGLAGTFFLNVYEHRKWGEAALRDIAAKLQRAGQDVALHTHPQFAYDPARTEMYQYSLDEQTAIIREGVQLLTAWTGRPVVAHRAGDYSADERTLKALERNGLRVDSSLFWGHPHCRLTGLGLLRNLPTSRGRLIEIPVTVYQREERPRLFGDMLAPVASVRKIDINWFLDKEEARVAVDTVIEADFPFLVVFLHSFSLLAGQEDSKVLVADRHARDILQAILDRVIQKRLPVVTMRELAESEVVAATSQDQDTLPRVTIRVGLHRYLWRRLRAAGTGVLAVGGGVLTLLAGGAVLIVARRRRTVADTGGGSMRRTGAVTRRGVSPR